LKKKRNIIAHPRIANIVKPQRPAAARALFLEKIVMGHTRAHAAALAGWTNVTKILNDDPLLETATREAEAQYADWTLAGVRRHAEKDPTTMMKLRMAAAPEQFQEQNKQAGGDFIINVSFTPKVKPIPPPPDVPPIIEQLPGGENRGAT
jgi:hypothetical protein